MPLTPNHQLIIHFHPSISHFFTFLYLLIMELELALSLSTHNFSDRFEPKKMVGFEPCRNNEECVFDMKKKKKRRLEEKNGNNDEFNGSINLPNLLLWSGQPNDQDDDDDQHKQKKFSFPLKNEEEDQIVGWPPIKSWRKKLLHHHRQQGGDGRVAAAGNENNNMNNGTACGTNSKYVKVKMEGVGIARKIDLRLFQSYQTLQNFLIRMFGDYQCKNDYSSNYTMTYQDEDGDWLLAGDVPWQSFIESVQCLELHRNRGLRGFTLLFCCFHNLILKSLNSLLGFMSDFLMEKLSFCIFLILMFVQVVYAQPATDPNEVAALNKLIDYWNLRSKLNISTDPCIQNASWANENANPRIACDCTATTCHITHLKIYALDIVGEIPSELFVLKKLMDLNLGQNVLNGAIPAEIGQLSNMEYLSLGINNLTGPLPPELGNLTKLLSLSFSSNNFFGQLPTSLGNLTSLQQLYIDSSGVRGPIPQEFALLKSLQILWASDNAFTGKLPEFFGTLTELRVLRLQGTLLQGPIPSSFSALNNLEDLRIGDLSGEDSSLEFLTNQTNLSVLILRNSLISGRIPERLGTFTKLKQLDFSFNKLTGRVPTSFQNLTSLQYLYLGSNTLSGELPADLIGPQLLALDVSFNPLSGNLPQNFAKLGLSMVTVGTSINANGLQESKVSGMLRCLQADTQCSYKIPSTSFSIKCGGKSQISASDVKYDDDVETLGAASLYASSQNMWAVSNTGNFISNPAPKYIVQTQSQITGTLESELYQTARISPSSLRYYGLGLKNGRYRIELHFAEIAMDDDDSRSWKGLGRRLFDVYIQGKKVAEDLNIQKEAGGSKRALIKSFEANVTNTIMDIHFFWAGKGTCCIPQQSTYGPLVSAIHVSQVSDGKESSKSQKKKVGKIVGIAVGCAAGVVIISSIIYLLWTKQSTKTHPNPKKPT
ncbi:probable LRR receptor-like serine/threonine-protein kinase At1g56140 [Mercurialis annua]|uniref:probable LRR receptor-like serine/threonine-protein kinase At1g56140 n=1 Tax=Mercurialis annua TaxID=3986 RepID=UPI00215E2447|nr:probable LRR receptor-like serine/threonine-protein kinase At1g56140 [Mercurialis annua]